MVVVHGTDSLEETGYLLDLHHDDERPVVITGSQRTADAAASDAPPTSSRLWAPQRTRSTAARGVLVAFGVRCCRWRAPPSGTPPTSRPSPRPPHRCRDPRRSPPRCSPSPVAAHRRRRRRAR
ncbi:MAG: asparaginase domain-containing protein [Quadrisphaera sp.]